MKRCIFSPEEATVLSLQQLLMQPGYHELVVNSEESIALVYKTLAYLSRFKRIAYISPINLPYARELNNLYSALEYTLDPISTIVEYDIVVIESGLCNPALCKPVQENYHNLRETSVCAVVIA